MSMKKHMEERGKIWEQQHKIREEFLEVDFRRREKRWEQLLKQRDEEWKEEMERRERALMQRPDSKISTFYNEQLKRDEDVLTFVEKKKEKWKPVCCRRQRGSSISTRNIQGVWKVDGEEGQEARDG